MFRFASIFSILWALLLNIQAEVDISYFGVDVSYYHPGYFKDVEVYLLDDNKLFGNITITNYLPKNIIYRVSITGATMGEYLVPTGFDTSLSICDVYDDPILIGPALEAFNFPKDVCPPSPGTYVVEEFEQDLSLYPDTFPPNNYLVKTELYNDEEKFFQFHLYQRIV